jgi:hypothetical protein
MAPDVGERSGEVDQNAEGRSGEVDQNAEGRSGWAAWTTAEDSTAGVHFGARSLWARSPRLSMRLGSAPAGNSGLSRSRA